MAHIGEGTCEVYGYSCFSTPAFLIDNGNSSHTQSPAARGREPGGFGRATKRVFSLQRGTISAKKRLTAHFIIRQRVWKNFTFLWDGPIKRPNEGVVKGILAAFERYWSSGALWITRKGAALLWAGGTERSCQSGIFDGRCVRRLQSERKYNRLGWNFWIL